MRTFTIALKPLVLLIGFMIFNINTTNAQQMDSLSYSLGILVGDNLAKQGFEKLDIASLADGLKAAITKSDMKLDQAAAMGVAATGPMLNVVQGAINRALNSPELGVAVMVKANDGEVEIGLGQ